MGLLKRILGKPAMKSYPTNDVLMMVVSGNVYSWDGNRVWKAGGSGVTNCIAEHKNQIYEGTIGGIMEFRPEEDQHMGDCVYDGGSIMALCSHAGDLFAVDGGAPGNKRHDILKLKTGNTSAGGSLGERVAEREDSIRGLSSHKGKLYDCGWYGVCETLTGEKVSDTICDVIVSHQGKLYGVSPGMIIDVFTGEEYAPIDTMACDPGMCVHNYHLVNSERRRGVRDIENDQIILPFEKVAIARGRRGPVNSAPDMISVNGLTYVGATRGREAAFKAIESEYKDQISAQTVGNIPNMLHGITQETASLMDPGTELWPEQAMFIPNLLSEFNSDPQLGMIHGDDRGHSIIRTDALREIAGKQKFDDYVSLVKAFFEQGYHVKRVGYIHFHTR